MFGANQTLTIESHLVGEERDVEGRRIGTFTQTATVQGNLFERATREIIDNVWTTVGEWLALLPAGTVISHHDVIVDENGHRYRVESVRNRLGIDGNVHHVSCACVLVGGS